MLLCQGALNIGLSNHKLKSALNCTMIRSNERIGRYKTTYNGRKFSDYMKYVDLAILYTSQLSR